MPWKQDLVTAAKLMQDVVCTGLATLLVISSIQIDDSATVHHMFRMCAFVVIVNAPVCLQLWRGIAEHLSSSQPEIVILLHQLPPLKEDRKGGINTGQWASQEDKMFTGMASHEALNQSRLKYCSMLLRDGIAEGVLAGKVGDCCEGDVRNQIVPFSRQQHSQTNWDQHHHGSDSGEQLVDFWGLVVQSKVRSDAEGAYVLKTVRNSNPVGCQCTHYSLMRVCKGDLVKTHMSSAWLLNR